MLRAHHGNKQTHSLRAGHHTRAGEREREREWDLPSALLTRIAFFVVKRDSAPSIVALLHLLFAMAQFRKATGGSAAVAAEVTTAMTVCSAVMRAHCAPPILVAALEGIVRVCRDAASVKALDSAGGFMALLRLVRRMFMQLVVCSSCHTTPLTELPCIL